MAREREISPLLRKRFKIDDHVVPIGVEGDWCAGTECESAPGIASNDDLALDFHSARSQTSGTSP